jgi:hypothetical protein
MEELKPVNGLGQRHGKWYIIPKSFDYTGYSAYFVNDEIFGFSEDLNVESIVYQSEYYAK